MADLPFMPLYVADYLADTTHLSCEAHGSYLLILMVMWKSGGELPKDDKTLAKISRLTAFKWDQIKSDVLGMFEVNNEIIYHKRVKAEIQKAKNISEVRSEISKRAVEAKRLKRLEQPQPIGNGLDNQTENKGSTHSQPSHTSYSIEERKEEPKKVLPKEKRATRLPENFEPDATCQAIADQMSLTSRQSQIEFEKFKDYWRAKSGASGTKLDWQATFRNWLRNANPRGTANGQQKHSVADGFEKVRAVIAERERRELEESGIFDEEVDLGLPRLQQGST